MSSYKQAILLREDLNMSKGKMIAQACHASLKAYKKADEKKRSEWESSGAKKVTLEVDEESLRQKRMDAEASGLTVVTVKDAGHTEVDPGTETAIAIGPDEESRIDSVTGDLKLIK
ncbi:peptidyl-tRNA hydrolase Pth2 [Candidatus Nanosalina sp. VS9-1]|uniref:peptidyl-tRNA hydrolase Pth2 n=1 Tax=Candidatus Nanosalina sp. VS9-1 TaxID=3388566 RepID=UPI0039E057E2